MTTIQLTGQINGINPLPLSSSAPGWLVVTTGGQYAVLGNLYQDLGNPLLPLALASNVSNVSATAAVPLTGGALSFQPGYTYTYNGTTWTGAGATPSATTGQQTMANSAPVVVALDQTPIQTTAAVSNFPSTQNVAGTVAVAGTVPVSLPGAATAANQTNGNQVTSVNNFPATQTVSGTVAISGTVPVSVAASIPLPAGAATSANQATEITSLASIVTNQTNGTQVAVLGVGSAAFGNQTDYSIAGTITSGSNIVTTAILNGVGSLTVQVTGTWTASGGLLLQVSNTGLSTDWVTCQYRPDNSTNTSTSISTNGISRIPFGGHGYFRIQGQGTITGTAVVTIRASAAVAFTTLVEPLPAGTATIGGVTGTGTSGTPAGNVLSTQTPTTSATTTFVGNGTGTPVSMIGSRGCGCHIGVPTGTTPTFTLTPQYSMDGVHYYNSTFLDPIAGTPNATLTITSASSDQAWVIRTPAGCQSIQLVSSAFGGTGSPTLATTLYTSQCIGNYQ
jgi:hypothetical protein